VSAVSSGQGQDAGRGLHDVGSKYLEKNAVYERKSAL